MKKGQLKRSINTKLDQFLNPQISILRLFVLCAFLFVGLAISPSEIFSIAVKSYFAFFLLSLVFKQKDEKKDCESQ